MLYYIFEFLQNNYDLPGASVFQYISFRAALAVITSLLVSLVFGGHIIRFIERKQIGEEVRVLGLKGEEVKRGTPTMGGLIIISAILIPTLLFTKLDNIYIQIMIVSTLWLGIIGFIDDYIKVFKKNKEGLAGRFKIFGQVGIGIIVGLIMVFHSDIVIKEDSSVLFNDINLDSNISATKSSKTTIPFFKNNEFDYH
ncbi:MAG: phospho-N-acetylmuramoyl-pentapeptide-transferase, partial [Flavobacteriales bacterium]|nr:phospho-N-acetylmuramoyl-pentapeptide-transferase [Flavobacteriales bacterium]